MTGYVPRTKYLLDVSYLTSKSVHFLMINLSFFFSYESFIINNVILKFILNIKYFFPHDIIQSFTLTPNRKNIFLVALLYSEGKLTFFDLAKSDCQKTFLCNNNPVTCTF